ncbi:Hypothetical predicted protein [Paramuricea clavata]|uniref:Uncharacterized protein n=1 Tax=Paramuricea clavata TaxID=317549 RepID=A0A6S7I262_PARCT|nr:Hypothetical predicted protein [Paramuricea clavata]
MSKFFNEKARKYLEYLFMNADTTVTDNTGRDFIFWISREYHYDRILSDVIFWVTTAKKESERTAASCLSVNANIQPRWIGDISDWIIAGSYDLNGNLKSDNLFGSYKIDPLGNLPTKETFSIDKCACDDKIKWKISFPETIISPDDLIRHSWAHIEDSQKAAHSKRSPKMSTPSPQSLRYRTFPLKK